MKKFIYAGNRYWIEFDEADDRYNQIRIGFQHAKDIYIKEFTKEINSVFDKNSFKDAIIHIGEIAESYIDTVVERHLISTLLRFNIYDFSLDRVRSEYDIYGIWMQIYYPLIQRCQNIMSENEVEHEYRDLRKDSRTRIVGGGFGLKGAAKGMATAGAINGLTGAAHSAVNMLGNLGSNYKMNSRLKALDTKETRQALIEAFEENILELSDVAADILNSKGIETAVYDSSAIRKNQIIIENCYKRDLNEIGRAINEAIIAYPYNEQNFLTYYLLEYDHTQDSEFDELVEYLGYSSDKLKRAALDTEADIAYDKNEDKYISGIEAYCDARTRLFEKIPEKANTFRVEDIEIDEEESEKKSYGKPELFSNNDVLQSGLKKHDFDKLTCEELVEYTAWIKPEVLTTNEEDGVKIFKGTPEHAIHLLETRKKIRILYDRCNIQNMDSIINTVEEMEKLTKRWKIGEDLLTHLSVAGVNKYRVWDIEISETGTYRTLQASSVGERMLKNRIKTVEECTYQCKSTEEQQQLKAVMENFIESYNNLKRNDIEEVHGLLVNAKELYQSCGLGKALIEDLSKREQKLDKEQRTVLGHEYSDLQSANAARKKVAGTRSYETESEASNARTELQAVEDIITKKTKDKNRPTSKTLGKVLAWRMLENMSFVYPSSNDRIEKLEQEIINEYHSFYNAEKDVQEASRKSALYGILGIPVTVIGILFFLGGGLIVKIISFFVVAGLWAQFSDLRGEVNEYNKYGKAEWKKIQSLIMVKNGKLQYIGKNNS